MDLFNPSSLWLAIIIIKKILEIFFCIYFKISNVNLLLITYEPYPLLGGTCYVPLIRSDTTGPYAKVGVPYSPTSPYRLVPEIEGAIRQDHHDQLEQETAASVRRPDVSSRALPPAPSARHSSPALPIGLELRDFRNMRVWAYAGPMSPQEV